MTITDGLSLILFESSRFSEFSVEPSLESTNHFCFRGINQIQNKKEFFSCWSWINQGTKSVMRICRFLSRKISLNSAMIRDVGKKPIDLFEFLWAQFLIKIREKISLGATSIGSGSVSFWMCEDLTPWNLEANFTVSYNTMSDSS